METSLKLEKRGISALWRLATLEQEESLGLKLQKVHLRHSSQKPFQQQLLPGSHAITSQQIILSETVVTPPIKPGPTLIIVDVHVKIVYARIHV